MLSLAKYFFSFSSQPFAYFLSKLSFRLRETPAPESGFLLFGALVYAVCYFLVFTFFAFSCFGRHSQAIRPLFEKRKNECKSRQKKTALSSTPFACFRVSTLLCVFYTFFGFSCFCYHSRTIRLVLRGHVGGPFWLLAVFGALVYAVC